MFCINVIVFTLHNIAFTKIEYFTDIQNHTRIWEHTQDRALYFPKKLPTVSKVTRYVHACQILFSITKILKYKVVYNITYAKRCWDDNTWTPDFINHKVIC